MLVARQSDHFQANGIVRQQGGAGQEVCETQRLMGGRCIGGLNGIADEIAFFHTRIRWWQTEALLLVAQQAKFTGMRLQRYQAFKACFA